MLANLSSLIHPTISLTSKCKKGKRQKLNDKWTMKEIRDACRHEIARKRRGTGAPTTLYNP